MVCKNCKAEYEDIYKECPVCKTPNKVKRKKYKFLPLWMYILAGISVVIIASFVTCFSKGLVVFSNVEDKSETGTVQTYKNKGGEFIHPSTPSGTKPITEKKAAEETKEPTTEGTSTESTTKNNNYYNTTTTKPTTTKPTTTKPTTTKPTTTKPTTTKPTTTKPTTTKPTTTNPTTTKSIGQENTDPKTSETS